MKLHLTSGAIRSGGICVIIGLLTSCWVTFHAYQNESAAIQNEFKHEMNIQAAYIEDRFVVNIAALHSVRALYEASEVVTRAEFQTFTRYVLNHNRSLHAIEWVPFVKADEREDFEMRARDDGFDQFQFTEKNEQGHMVGDRQRDEYCPVYYIEPLAGNQSALGFNLLSDTDRRDALYATRDTGEPRATGRIRLVQKEFGEEGGLIFVPVYDGSPKNKNERISAIRGVVAGVLRLNHLMDTAPGQMPAHGLVDMRLVDVISDREAVPLRETRLDGIKLATAYRYEKRLSPQAGRTWTLIATPSVTYVAQKRTTAPLTMFILGLLITGWASYCLTGLARKKQLIEHEVEIRTRELQTQSTALANSNANLKHEIAERKLLQERLTHVTDQEQRRLGQDLHDSLGQQIAVIMLLADSMQLQLEAEHAKVPEPLRRLRVSAQHAQAQVRALTKGLLPREIDHWGLSVALKELVESTKDVSDVSVEFKGEENVTVSNALVATHLYRIAQEALRNALEHGHVSRTTISLSRHENTLKLAICDDGTGFDVGASTPSGAGLFGMRHRAELIGARLEVQSSEESGTSVTCVLSIPPKGENSA